VDESLSSPRKSAKLWFHLVLYLWATGRQSAWQDSNLQPPR